jgi:hypothetical protein
MLQTNLNVYRFRPAALAELTAVALLFVAALPARSIAQQKDQKTFSSPEEASNALVTAAQNDDEKAMLDILGSQGKQVVSSGDDAEDAGNRANFVQRYQEMHRLVKEPDGTTTLYAGADNWPLPIPLVSTGRVWYFDTEAAKKEILYRRIGKNEVSTIRVCQELVAAEKEYYAAQHKEYADKFFSGEGQHDGLYWKAGEGETPSPIGPLVAAAVLEGYTQTQNGGPTPYRGYYYRILTRQGEKAAGGARNYIVNGKMTTGFAFVAYPAEYRVSGVMTFIVGPDGVVYQKDLGSQTTALAKTMKEYNPGAGWEKQEDQQEETAAQQETK